MELRDFCIAFAKYVGYDINLDTIEQDFEEFIQQNPTIDILRISSIEHPKDVYNITITKVK